MPAPFITYAINPSIFNTTEQSLIYITEEEASSGRVDITYFNDITPLFLTLDRLCLVQNIDYEIIKEDSSTFIQFINEVAPSGISALEAGEVLTFVYNSVATESNTRQLQYVLTPEQCSENRIDVTQDGNFSVLMLALDRICLVQNIDYELQILGSRKYLYFINELSQSGNQAIEPGEVVTMVVKD